MNAAPCCNERKCHDRQDAGSGSDPSERGPPDHHRAGNRLLRATRYGRRAQQDAHGEGARADRHDGPRALHRNTSRGAANRDGRRALATGPVRPAQPGTRHQRNPLDRAHRDAGGLNGERIRNRSRSPRGPRGHRDIRPDESRAWTGGRHSDARFALVDSARWRPFRHRREGLDQGSRTVGHDRLAACPCAQHQSAHTARQASHRTR